MDRNGHAGRLPDHLPASLRVVWRKPLSSPGHGGIAATRKYVIVGDRELNAAIDLFRCFDTTTGAELWTARCYAPGSLDYGNAPRASPQIVGDRAILFGAMGHLTSVDLASGKLQWRVDIRDEFDVTAKLSWGFCGSPLVLGDKVILYPGGNDGALVALGLPDGKTKWTAEGEPAAYGSFIAAELGGRRQIVGYDATSLGGWDSRTGERLWKLVPDRPSDFNVPTPIVHKGRLIVSTENNGTRMYRFQPGGLIDKQPMAAFRDLAPETHTPVVVGNRLFGIFQELYCLDLDDNLALLWKGNDDGFLSHVNLIGAKGRLLASSETGDLLLIDADAGDFRVLGRASPFPKENGLMSHPAIVDGLILLRGNSELLCLSLEP